MAGQAQRVGKKSTKVLDLDGNEPWGFGPICTSIWGHCRHFCCTYLIIFACRMLHKGPWAPGCRGGWNFYQVQSQGECEDFCKISADTNCYETHLTLEKQLMLNLNASLKVLLISPSSITQKLQGQQGSAHPQPQHEKLGEDFWGALAALLVPGQEGLGECSSVFPRRRELQRQEFCFGAL